MPPIFLADRETIVHHFPHGPVRLRKYAARGGGREFVRASVPARVPTRDGGRAALVTLRPAAYPYAGRWLAAIVQYAPERADHRNPAFAPGSVRVLARMTRTHANGVPRQSDGSVGWSVPGASARVWPDGRVEVRDAGLVVLSVRLEGSAWDSARVAAVADAGLRLLCAPEARHLIRTSEPRGWSKPADRWGKGGPDTVGVNGGWTYDGSSVGACSCGWRVSVPSRDGARGAAAEHLREVGVGVPA
ncbi:hypothetical protein [Streptomyces rimosus]|uniref:hypothetical protein n=1 Tax=Streptomyces rimosus TaxID=1927 RepID=UPI0004C14588|nr:hypothetical protein [Streptomyces rimosus]